jgi:hypothetical protein
MSWDDVNKSLQNMPGWPEKFSNAGTISFARVLTEAQVKWWNETFVEKYGLYPEDLALKFAGGAPGKRKIEFGSIDPLSDSFYFAIEGNEGNRQVWFQANSIHIRDGFIYHDRMDVSAEHRGQRMAQSLMRGVHEFMLQMNIKRMQLDAQDIGGYLWASAGFRPVGSWSSLSYDIHRRLSRLRTFNQVSDDDLRNIGRILAEGENDPRMFWALARMKKPVTSSHRRSLSDPDVIALGKELLIGVNWKGELDLDDRFSRLVFERWLRRK